MSAVPKLWPGSTICCIASGPSLTQEDVDVVRGKARVLVVNNNYTLAPWADALYAADTRWWKWHWNKGPAGFEHMPVKAFEGLKVTVSKEATVYKGVVALKKTGESGLDTNPSGLRSGRNSGYQAINLAVHLGASRIVLLGYDMQTGPQGQEHHHADHPNRSRSPYKQYASFYPSLVEPLAALKIEVINCTVRTALTCFPCRPLREVFSAQEVAA